MHKILEFNPIYPLNSGYWQTVFGSFGTPLSPPSSERLIVDVSDGDQLCLEMSTPYEWSSSNPTVVLVHGLGGDSYSKYMVRISRKLFDMGVQVVRINLRGAGCGETLARKPANGGCSDDVLRVLEKIKTLHPHSPLKIVGFSLGGNIVLKLLGELGHEGESLIRESIVVCPSIDLYQSAMKIGSKENWLFEKYYMRALIALVKRKHRIFPDLPLPNLSSNMSIYQFDDIYTAPLTGFSSANEYYARCSAKSFIDTICVPTKILYDLDDPIVPGDPIMRLQFPSCVQRYATKCGGHLGYLGWTGAEYGLRWMDKQVVQWLTT